MSKPKRPEAVIVDYFTNAPLDAAESVLAIVKGIVDNRRPKTTKKAAPAKRPALRPTPHDTMVGGALPQA